ncbi:MAG: GNAT family N-acetyltransferase [Chloroflexota bacterium]|nr:GNAT family N-acetyltransferase [Chloroflexota bacterium]
MSTDTDPEFLIDALAAHHDRTTFTRGVEPLDRYLHRQAGQDHRRGAARAFVVVDPRTDRLAGFSTLSAATVQPAGLPDAIAKRLPRYPTLPAILIGRLAVAIDVQGQHPGEHLALDALRRALRATSQVAAVAILGDAKDDRAHRFDDRHGFLPCRDDPDRRFLPMGTVAGLFDPARP